MEFLDNLKISRKLAGSFFILILMLVIVALVGLLNMMEINDGVTAIYDDRLIPLSQIASVSDELLYVRGDTLKFALLPNERAQLKETIAQNREELESLIEEYKKNKLLPEEEAELKKFEAAWKDYYSRIQGAIALFDSGKETEAIASISTGGSVADARKPVDDAIANLYQINQKDAERIKSNAVGRFTNSVLIIAIVTIIGIIISLVLAITITRSITIPCVQVKELLSEMSMGHLSGRLHFRRKDELGDMARTMDSFSDDLQHKAVGVIRRIAQGERIDIALMKDETDEIGSAINTLATALRGLTEETTNLINAAKNGDLSVRGDDTKFQGRFRNIVAGINETLESVIIPVQEAMRLSKSYANGNFVDRVNPSLAVAGDFIDFKNALNHLGKETSLAIGNVKNEVEGITAGMEETASSVEEVANSVELLTENSSHVSSLAEKSGEGIQQTLTAMEDLSRTVGSVANKAENASALAQKTVDLSNDGMELAGNAEKGMENIIESFAGTETIVNDITNQMDEIGRIVDVITGIAEQTGLLALNAAIEAARAGDAGMGFAVVADEVKSLALESQKSAENIATIIGNLQKKTQMVSDSMKSSSNEVKTGNEAVGKTLQVFDQIVQAINEVHQNMTEVAGAAEEQAAAVQEITASITEVDDMVRQTAKEAVHSAAATEEVSASVEQINRVITDASIALQRISSDMGRFNVG
ncbi:methyl-accepting chemotaxis protein [Methanospirillum sp. J.3.6.1-F.2.7.3]|uniref:Methyl-accepting chemotaxis protein n=1 Tax=Methanospirillum purgamenti TaxID=2834276 RepID=A0A8E7EKM1_9EURY|nr:MULTISPECIES: methyl-accepting chemotaxis protein [Methanospirillum]MDX8551651.1 methyl-accepting chemotaxis protein [Methanospirillum hungatei]QVV90344.1 methyl-accepting chemotaxis protein [Methanospirillum sp. J.3.6.1-F.2.7.3]